MAAFRPVLRFPGSGRNHSDARPELLTSTCFATRNPHDHRASTPARRKLATAPTMQVSSSGSTDLHALVMFVVDAKRPFSPPAALP